MIDDKAGRVEWASPSSDLGDLVDYPLPKIEEFDTHTQFVKAIIDVILPHHCIRTNEYGSNLLFLDFEDMPMDTLVALARALKVSDLARLEGLEDQQS